MRGSLGWRRWVAAAGIGALASVGLTGLVALPAQADTAPVDPTLPTTVTADALPTVQINGVVWNQQIVGNTVYVAGNFTSARPAGSPAGTNEVPRTHMLAYNLTTGALIASFNPNINGQVRDLALSPDGTTLYAAGQFTSVNGQTRYRTAAFNAATGALTSWRPVVNSTVAAIGVSSTQVFLGGSFTSVNSQPRAKVAAVSTTTGATNGALDAPVDGGSVNALTVAPDGASVVIGGSFTNVGGSSNPGYGLARLDAATGANLPLPVNQFARNAGANAAILSLETDGTNFYGSGFHFGGAGNVEGTFAARWSDGEMVWIEDCHGDTYSAFPAGNAVYQASHKHYCANSGGFPQTEPWSFNRGTAVTKDARRINTPDIYGYPDHDGEPSPEFLNWYPDLNSGTFTGKSQGPWTVSGNSQYVLMGGEFTRVNNTPQQGLVRFAVSAIAPDAQGPRLSGAGWPLGAASFASGTVRVAWKANWDRDNQTLTYRLYRGSNAAPPIYETTLTTPFWDLETMGFVDTGLTPGSTQRYRLSATDAFGNTTWTNWLNDVVVSSDDAMSDYAEQVLADGADTYWRLGEASGPTVFDWAAFNDGTANAGVTRGVDGAILGDTNDASRFTGAADGFVTSASAIPGPDTFTVETWVKTTSTSGGKLIGFGNNATGQSTNYDRHVYMDNAGRIWFGVHPGGVRTVNSAASFNDGEWHHVVASLGANGMRLYVDGKRVGQRTDVTFGQGYAGFWRVGGDNINGWTNQPASHYLAGDLDDVAIYDTVLTHEQVLDHYTDSGRTSVVPPAPADAYGAAVYAAQPDLYWRLDEAAGTVAADASINGVTGTYRGGVGLGAAGAIAGTSGTAATFNGSSSFLSSDQSYANPRNYSEELWFKTTTTNGGKIIGFGTSPDGLSGGYDRHVYMETDGRLTFGVWTGFTNTTTTSDAYNDGQWHHLVATQSSTTGLALYVDGVLRGTNGQTSAQDYVGHWKVGADNTWGPQPYFQGTIDEVAVYPTTLSAQTVAEHWSIGSATPPLNQAPVAAFTATPTHLSVAVDGSGSTDPDGTVASHVWSWGDGTPDGSGATATHAYAAAGTYTVTLTVTDDDGATNAVTHDVTVTAPPVNQLPVAAFTATPTHLSVAVDGSGSTDADGTITAYSWSWGDGTANGAGATASHAYATPGTYTVTLTVTDDDGGTNVVAHDVTVTAPPANQAPVAAFTASPTHLSVAVDGSGSADPDGTVVSYAWAWGDGSPAGSGATASHAYAAAGTYTVTLTVTDDDGATHAVAQDVTVTAPPAGVLAADTFTRAVTGGWGTAETGGAWTATGTASRFSVDGVRALHAVPAGGTLTSSLALSSTDTEVRVVVSPDKVPTGGGAFVHVQARRVTATDYYGARLRLQADGSVQLHVTRGNGTPVAGVVVPGLTYAAGDQLNVRVQATGVSPTTVRAKVWKVGTTEPAAWQTSMTDATASLQAAGGVGFSSYVFGSATNAPVVLAYDDLWVGPAQP
ncbi:LamG domain-containing protein [Actinotalea solisilvae]|uniref:LamG domain-containing protein n=1 Tax=Actinotalea solisilvae TaxID=2072922 RepID=UPI0018F1D5C8|nr:LamG domain-containing protein [Actinotalea solisilvae]